MSRRTTAAAGVLLAGVLSFGISGTAHAANIYNCPDFVTQADAQAVYDADRSDPNLLDRDKDGQACEDNDYVAHHGTVTSAMALGTTGQVTSRPAGAVAAGDGSVSANPSTALPYLAGGLALAGAGGAAFAARRSRRVSA
jgi:hypothetical protein